MLYLEILLDEKRKILLKNKFLRNIVSILFLKIWYVKQNEFFLLIICWNFVNIMLIMCQINYNSVRVILLLFFTNEKDEYYYKHILLNRLNYVMR